MKLSTLFPFANEQPSLFLSTKLLFHKMQLRFIGTAALFFNMFHECLVICFNNDLNSFWVVLCFVTLQVLS